MKKSKYPRWFSPFNRPCPPARPPENITSLKKIDGELKYTNAEIPVERIPEGTTHILIDVCRGYDDDIEISIDYVAKSDIPNPNYEQQLAKYNKDNKEYKQKLKEWNEVKAQYDAEQEAKNEASERALYNKLKKKFEKV